MIRALVLVPFLLAACTGPIPPAGSTRPASTSLPAASTTPTAIALPTTLQISAPSANTIWALVGERRVLRSIDQGASWVDRGSAPGAGRGEIAFAGAQEGWLASPGAPATQCQSQSVGLWHTLDAGGTWIVINPTGLADRQCKERLVFVDPLHGFLDGWDPNTAPVIYRTMDGGQTWVASRPLPDPPGFTSTGGGFTLRADTVRGLGTTLLVDAIGNNASEFHRYVFGSTDGGASWTYRNTGPDPMIAVTFVTATRWLQLGGQRSQETVDAGASWNPFATDYPETAPAEVVFADPQVGYATAPRVLFRTLDGGAHWTSLRMPGS